MSLEESSRLPFFDTFCRVGRRRARGVGEPYSVEHLQAYRSAYGIEDVAVEHAVAVEASPRLGNGMLREEIAGYAGLHAAWHLMPVTSPRIEPAVTDPAELLDARVVLTRVDVQEFGDGIVMGYEPVLRALEACHVPLAIDFAGRQAFLNFDVSLFGRFPGLPFIVENFGGYPLHRLLWAMREFPNVHLSTAGFTLHCGPELICGELGADRLIFGSGWPQVPAGMALGPVLLNGLSRADRCKVAGDNFRALMEGIG